MTQDADRELEISALDYLLKDKPTAFQRDLLLLARRAHWDENDPGFAVPLAMGQIENVLEVYPARMKAAMDEISQRSEMKWERIQAALKVSAVRGETAATRMDGRLAQVRSLLDLEISQVKDLLQAERLELQKAMADERAAAVQMMADERAEMARLAQMLTEQQKQVLAAQTKELIAQGVVTSREIAANQVKEIVASAKVAHYWQSFAWACGAALGVMLLTGLGLGQAQRVSEWGRFEQWNQQQLKDCRNVDENTCNFHIKPPQ
jgi:DNA-binding transcriptional MerR regulator